MIRLHYSNRLENLIAPLAEVVAAEQRRAPLQPVAIVVPNRAVEQFVRCRLAEAIGVAANLRFPFLRNYLAELLKATDKKLKVLDADELQLVLFECLRSSAGRDDPGLKPARDYIQAGSKAAADVECRTMLLAAELARLFREYSISRRRMIAKWRSARRSELDAMGETERWQRHLWQLVFDSHGRVRENWLKERGALLMMLPDAFAEADGERLKAALSAPLHVFGASYAGSAYGEIFARLSALGDVRIYALNPCREFWEDIHSSRRGAFTAWTHRHDRIGERLAESEDPFGLNEPSDPPALRLWGRPGREYVRLLNELTQCDFAPLFSDPVCQKPATLLQALQQSILDRRPHPADIKDGGWPGEAGIRFLAAPGIRREAEIVASEIWSIVRDNEKRALSGGAERIRFHEIAVLVCDAALDDYLAHIESVFRKLHQIPIDRVGRTSAGSSRVGEAVELLLDLPRGRFTRAEMLRILTHPALNDEARIDLEMWPRWSEALGVFFGADDDELAPTYIPRGLYSWDQALKRLALGTMLGGLSGANPAFFPAGATAPGYLPLEVAQDEIETAARFLRGARALIADALSIRSAQLTPRQWSRMVIEFLSAHLRPASALDERARDSCFEAIESIGESELRIGLISYESAREMIAARIAGLESRRGQFSRRGVAVGSLSALRSIPFKVIFLLGLNQGVFPEGERRDPLDLRTLKRIAGDVTPAERDRYLFLEAILAARERIFFSWVARDAKTGDPLEPSPAIGELQYMLRGFVDEKSLEKLTVKHPVSRYDLGYFREFDGSAALDGDNEFFSFDPDARRGARMLALRKKIAKASSNRATPHLALIPDRIGPRLRERLQEDLQLVEFKTERDAAFCASLEEIDLPIAAIRKYLECPIQGAARYALKMLEDGEAPSAAEDEPVEQSRLDRTVMLRTVFRRAGGNPESLDEEYAREFQIAQAHGRAPAGNFARAAETADLTALRRWVGQALQAGVADFDRWKDIQIGRADEFADAGEIHPPIALDATVRRHDGTTVTQRVNLYGTIRGASAAAGAAINCVLHKNVKAKDFIPPFLSAIVLAASGAKLGERFRAIVIGTESTEPGEFVRELRLMDQDSALGFLETVAGDLLSAGNDYFLPIEAVAEVVKELDKPLGRRDLVEAVERVRFGEFAKSSSEYGPVRNAASFDPPDEEEIEAIVARRFKPIIGIFE